MIINNFIILQIQIIYFFIQFGTNPNDYLNRPPTYLAYFNLLKRLITLMS